MFHSLILDDWFVALYSMLLARLTNKKKINVSNQRVTSSNRVRRRRSNFAQRLTQYIAIKKYIQLQPQIPPLNSSTNTHPSIT